MRFKDAPQPSGVRGRFVRRQLYWIVFDVLGAAFIGWSFATTSLWWVRVLNVLSLVVFTFAAVLNVRNTYQVGVLTGVRVWSPEGNGGRRHG